MGVTASIAAVARGVDFDIGSGGVGDGAAIDGCGDAKLVFVFGLHQLTAENLMLLLMAMMLMLSGLQPYATIPASHLLAGKARAIVTDSTVAAALLVLR